METWVEEMEGWDQRPFSGGYAGLRDLADADFSGAVAAGDAWLFVVSGRVVGVVERRETATGSEVQPADVDVFEDASGTAYAAPHPSVPLLVAMQVADGETRGQYYTEDTPVEEVVATLEDGGFTGYLELSENVLSGDYYVVFQSGRPTDLAYIGNARRLLTEDDAHERLTDEVGIYEVVSVGIDVVEIPGEPSDDGGAAAVGAAGVASAASEPDGPADESTDADQADAVRDESTDGDPGGAVPDESTADAAAAADSGPVSDDVEAGSLGATEGDSSGTDGPRDEGEVDASDDPRDEGVVDATDGMRDDEEGDVTAASAPDAAGASTLDDLESRSVPSLDPERSWTADEDGPSTAGDDGESGGSTSASEPDVASTAAAESGGSELAAVRAELREAREKLSDARSELAATQDERDEFAAQVEELRQRVRELQAEENGAGPTLSAAEALSATNLFVRYDSKGRTTVEDVHDGDGELDDLLENLQLSHHAQFEAEHATVGGEPFEAWLHGTQQFRFVQWLVTTLPIEIRETGSADALRELYDGLPAIDRVELDGSVTVETEDGEREVGFDVVCRDRMGDPLVAAVLETSRDPVTESSMGALITDATDVASGEESLSAAFYVTSAFFSPESLETAREATSGSLLSRDRRESYVKISRNRGYHLGLAESREQTFHLSVPDL